MLEIMTVVLIHNSFKFVNTVSKRHTIILRTLHNTTVRCGSCHLEHSPNSKLNKSILDRYMCLPLPECKIQAKYIWIDGTGDHLRSKTRTLEFVPASYKDCPNWGFDGSSTYQATPENSDVWLCPCALYNDPIRRGNNKLILCETYMSDHKPTKTNHRNECVQALNKVCDAEPMFGFEQEYIFVDADRRPYGWPIMMGHPAASGPYYCGVGAAKVYCRDIVEAHYRACLYAGVQLYGTNAEVALSQWEFQIGPGFGIKAADDLWMARFLLHRIAEEYGVGVSLDPKLIKEWNGSGCHTTISTKDTRADGGMKAIERAICLLEKKHAEHIKAYDPRGGQDNKRRLSGKHETSTYDTFATGIANRNASVRIPRPVSEAKKGYLEDRRPASNCDPYSVVNMLTKTILLADAGKK